MQGFSTPTVPGLPKGLDLPVVRSMHRLFGKGYAGGGDHQCLRPSGWSMDVFVVASSNKFVLLASVQGDGQSNLVTGSNASFGKHVKLESLILAQNERWRQA